MKFTILTLFPELFPGPLAASVTGRALDDGRWQLDVVDIREFAGDKHRSVDDTPYGGGAGMVLKADVLAAAIESVQPQPTKWLAMSPRGAVWRQNSSMHAIEDEHIGIICGRFEGIDQRVLDEYQVAEISIGDYVLTGGEMAAYVVVDSVLRHVPGILGNGETLSEESFCGDYANLLEYPHYTRPPEWRGRAVPEMLLSGHHGEIEKWRLEQAKDLTRRVRPDIYARFREDENK